MIASSSAPPVAYLWEPFSPLARPGVRAARFPYWFAYVCKDNESDYFAPLRDMLAFRYRADAEVRACRSARDVGRMLRDRWRFAHCRRIGARPLMKDPIALFSSEWIADTFQADVVVVIRHPAAFAGSIKQRGWVHPFDHFLRQPLLMRDLLGPFEAEIRQLAATEHPPLDQAILLWKLMYSAVLRFRERRPEWQFVRLEDIAADPQEAFERMYRSLGLVFDDHVRAAVSETSDASNPVEVADPAMVRRNSLASVNVWRRRLSPSEVERVRTGVEPVGSAFYTDADW